MCLGMFLSILSDYTTINIQNIYRKIILKTLNLRINLFEVLSISKQNILNPI